MKTLLDQHAKDAKVKDAIDSIEKELESYLKTQAQTKPAINYSVAGPSLHPTMNQPVAGPADTDDLARNSEDLH